LSWRHSLWIPLTAVLFVCGCSNDKARKPDPTKGAVSGVALCADTGKPARFATVTLSAAPKKGTKLEGGDPLPAAASTVTDLDGKFRIEAVDPGKYYLFATLEGYLDPERGIDFARLAEMPDDRARNLDAIEQWKDRLVEVDVRVNRASEAALSLQRGAEIGGTVTFDDNAPAIGMHFQLFRRSEKDQWTEVGVALFRGWSIEATSDGHGRFNIGNLPAGEYSLCALMPAESQDAAPRVCLGDTFRRKKAETVKVQAGEIATGVDIEIPLSGMHTVAGTVTALPDGHPLGRGTAQLLYADDRELARKAAIQEDGGFSFAYVPEDKYILQIAGAQDAEPQNPDPKDGGTAPADSPAAATAASAVRHYADKEIPVDVQGETTDLGIALTPVPADQPAKP
jgi:hypothetical protein